MDVTPTDKMMQAMKMITDALCGEEPSKLLVGSGAETIRTKRRLCMDTLHSLVALAMKEGVNRKVKEIKSRQHPLLVDSEDRNAAAQAVHDANAGKNFVRINGADR